MTYLELGSLLMNLVVVDLSRILGLYRAREDARPTVRTQASAEALDVKCGSRGHDFGNFQ